MTGAGVTGAELMGAEVTGAGVTGAEVIDAEGAGSGSADRGRIFPDEIPLPVARDCRLRVPLDISRENQIDKQQKKKDDSHLHA